MLSAQLIHSKPCRAMNKESETAGDRELFSELFETPIHPLLINIVPPFVNEINPMFHFQLNGEALWRLREVCGQPSKVFQLLQLSFWGARRASLLINETNRTGCCPSDKSRNIHHQRLVKSRQFAFE